MKSYICSTWDITSLYSGLNTYAFGDKLYNVRFLLPPGELIPTIILAYAYL